MSSTSNGPEEKFGKFCGSLFHKKKCTFKTCNRAHSVEQFEPQNCRYINCVNLVEDNCRLLHRHESMDDYLKRCYTQIYSLLKNPNEINNIQSELKNVERKKATRNLNHEAKMRTMCGPTSMSDSANITPADSKLLVLSHPKNSYTTFCRNIINRKPCRNSCNRAHGLDEFSPRVCKTVTNYESDIECKSDCRFFHSQKESKFEYLLRIKELTQNFFKFNKLPETRVYIDPTECVSSNQNDSDGFITVAHKVWSGFQKKA